MSEKYIRCLNRLKAIIVFRVEQPAVFESITGTDTGDPIGADSKVLPVGVDPVICQSAAIDWESRLPTAASSGDKSIAGAATSRLESFPGTRLDGASSRCSIRTSISEHFAWLTSWKSLVVSAIWLLFLLMVPPVYALTAPTISPSSGSFTSAQTITMSAPAGNIYFTLDGSVPTNLSTQYTSSIIINSPTQVNAIAYQSGTYSPVTTSFLDVDSSLAPVLQSGLILRLTSGFGLLTQTSIPVLIDSWVDLSGSGNTATGTSGSQPVLLRRLGTNVVSFDGSSQFLSLPSGFANFTSGATFFLVVAPSSPSTSARFFDLGNGSASDNIFMSEPSSAGVDMHVYSGATDSSVSSSSAATVGQFQLIEGTYSGSSTATIFTNGSQDAQSTSMQTASNITRSNNYIGQASGGGNLYSGSIAELLMYSTQLSATQRVAVEASLIVKYGLLSLSPRTPIISVGTSTLSQPTQVTIATQPGTITYITTDGSSPSSSSPIYSGRITISYSQTVQAMSVANNIQSSVASATYTLDSSQFPAPNPSDTTAPTINLQLPAPSN